MSINLKELENLAGQVQDSWFEGVAEEELLAQLDAMAEPERLALFAKIPEEIRCGMGFLSDQQIAYQRARSLPGTTSLTSSDFGGFCGKYGDQYKDWLEAYCPEEFWEMVFSHTLKDACLTKNDEVHAYIEDTVKALLACDPAPDQNTHPLEWVQHMNALKAQAEEIAEPLIFGGNQLGELGIPKLTIPVETCGRPKNMFFDGTQEEWEAFDRPNDSLPF